LRTKEILFISVFSNHEPLLEYMDGLKIYQLNANRGFEAFTVEVHNIIDKEGREAFYVFDSLSDLQVAWSTDLMMGNFFCVTCPYLFELDTVALFPVLKRASRFCNNCPYSGDNTAVYLMCIRTKKIRFIHPIKVWNRYLPDMYMPYRLNDDNELESLTGSVDLADYYNLIHNEQKRHAEQNIDSYERFFREAREAYYRGEITDWTLNKITRSMMTRDHRMADLIRKEFSPEDYFHIKERMNRYRNNWGKGMWYAFGKKNGCKLPASVCKVFGASGFLLYRKLISFIHISWKTNSGNYVFYSVMTSIILKRRKN